MKKCNIARYLFFAGLAIMFLFTAGSGPALGENHALRIDWGSTPAVNFGDINALDNLGTLTVEAWFKFYDMSPHETRVIAKLDSRHNGLQLNLRNNGNIYAHVGNNGKSASITAKNNMITERVWYHVALVFDGGQTEFANRMKLYINGIHQTGYHVDVSTSNSPETIGGNSAPLTIGNNGSGQMEIMEIDELRFWNVARTHAQINENKDSTLTGTESGLVAYYRFDEGSGTTVNDSVGTNHGTLRQGSDGLTWVSVDDYESDMVKFSPTMQYIAGGTYHSLIVVDGKVLAWGNNSYGELGNGTTVNSRNTPVQVPDLSNVIAVSAHSASSFALKSDGTVWAWGYLGYIDNNAIYYTSPVQVPLSDVTAIAAGAQCLAVKSDGTVWKFWTRATSYNSTPVQISDLSEVTAVASGQHHSLALKSDGTVWAWGSAQSGLGDAAGTKYSATPVQVSGLSDVIAVSAGYYSSIALKSDGTVWSTGSISGVSGTMTQLPNLYDIIGVSGHFSLKSDGTVWFHEQRMTGVSNMTAVSSNQTGHAIAMSFNGSVLSISSSATYNTSTIAVPAPSGNRFSAGWKHNLMIEKTDGTVWAWGENYSGQLGDGTRTDRSTPVQVSDLSDVIAVSAGGGYSLALESDGTVWAWGGNNQGELGDGTITGRSAPVQVMDPADNIIAVSAGHRHSLALESDGTVWAWGANGSGQLGVNNYSRHSSPTRVANLSNATAIAAGYYFSLAQTSDRKTWAWGTNNTNQLGQYVGTMNITNSAVPIEAHLPTKAYGMLLGTAKIAAWKSALAISGDQRLIAWGAWKNSNPGEHSYIKVSVSDIAAGYDHNLALGADGRIWAWGENSYGQLGDGTNTKQNKTTVQGLSSVISVSAGGYHSLAMKSDGTLWAWGRNDYGQLGDGTTTNSNTPVQVALGKVSVETPQVPEGGVSPGTAGHLLYSISLTPEKRDATLGKITLRTAGTYLTSDITRFSLWYSADETLDAGDVLLGEKPVADTGTDLRFTEFANTITITEGSTGHLFLTADISATAGGARTLSVAAPPLSNISFAPELAKFGTPAQGGAQTFESASVAITSLLTISESIAKQGNLNHGLYGLKLNVSKKDVTLTGLSVQTAGDYQLSDISKFHLIYSPDATLDQDDAELTEHPADVSGTTLTFTGFSQAIPAGTAGYLFVTADIGAAVGVGRTLSVIGVNLGDIIFEVDPQKIGSDPATAGATHTLYAPPTVTIRTPEIAAAKVAQGTKNHIIYQISLSVSDNDTVLTKVILVPNGLYTLSDIDRLRLYASTASTFDPGADPLAEAEPVDPGAELSFAGFSHTIADGGSLYLFVTADINEDAGSIHSIHIGALNPDRLIFEQEDAVYSPQGEMLTGGAQTFPISPYIDMAAGFYHTIALKKNGTVWAWGNNENGQIGDGTTEDSVIALPTLELTGIRKLAAGDFFSLALKDDGTVWAYGQNDFGQLGDGTVEDRTQAVQVSGLTNIVGIAAGDAHSVALRDDGSVWTWGANRYGQLGDGTSGDSRTPLRVSALSDVIAVAAGGGWTMALKSDGTVWSWGQNDVGQLGDETTDNRNTPALISALSDVEAIAAGDYHGLALNTDGTVSAWGSNQEGQLGNGSFTGSLAPVQVSGLTAVTAIDAGSQHSIARLSDGTVRSWGWNKYGQLGDGTNDRRNQPVQVSGMSGATTVSAGGDFSLALRTDGTVWAWGHNRYGQFGDGSLNDRNIPVQGGVIPVIQIATVDTPAAIAPRGASDHILYCLKLEVSDADATLTGLTLTTGGDYELPDIADQGFTLRYSEDDVLDRLDKDKDPVLDVYDTVPPYGYLRFGDFSQLMEKGTTGYLFVTVNVGEDPGPRRFLFVRETMLDQMQFAEKNVFKSGSEPLPAGGRQTFPIITVDIGVPAVLPAEARQNTSDAVTYRLDLRKTSGTEDAILTSLTLTPRGTYRLSDIVEFRLRHSTDATLDPGDPLLAIRETVPSGEDIEFAELSQSISAETGYLFVTANVSVTAGGERTLFMEGTRFADIQFAQNFLDKTGTDQGDPGGAVTFPMSEINVTGASDPGLTEQRAANHLVYRIRLVTTDADATLTGLTLSIDGSYEVSDISGFRLFYSSDDQLDTDADPVLAAHVAVSRGEPFVFEDLSWVIRQGTGYLFLTADIGHYAVARDIFVGQSLIDGLTFADDVRFEPADVAYMAAGGIQTFPTPKVAVGSSAVPAVTVEQDTEDHPLYKIRLDVSDARALLTGASFTTAGTYQSSDINQFRLRYSADGTLDEQDPGLGTDYVVLPGEKIIFEDLFQTIEKGTSGYLFVTVDIGAANGARTIHIAETALENLGFQEPENLILSGTDPMIAGAVQTFPIPLIAIGSIAVPDAEIEQDMPNLVLYRISLAPTRAEAVLTDATFATQGTYISKDLMPESPFRLRYSENETLDDLDPALGTKPFVSPGEALVFSGLSRTIAKGSTGYLFLTADIGRANGARTINIGGPAFADLGFEFGDRVGTDPMAAGGVQTFPIPAIVIAAPGVAAAEVVQDTRDHVLYRLSLGITRAEAVLESLTLKTGGTYLPSDLVPEKPFRLRYSDNSILNPGDAVLGEGSFVGTDRDLTFAGLSQMIDKGTTGHLFITADLGPAVGRHIFISEMPFENMLFEFGDKLGEGNPTPAGGRQQFPVPNIAITSPPVESAIVEPGTVGHLMYRLDMGVTKADAILESLTLTPAGTYRSSDIRTDCSGMAPESTTPPADSQPTDYSAGIITTIAGPGMTTYPYGVCMDASGNIFVAETYNHRIRMIDPSGNISTVAGTGRVGYSGDGGPATAASLNRPHGIWANPSGDILVTEEFSHCIRRFTVGGDITTVAGTGRAGYSGDGSPATAARLNIPYGVCADASGNIFVADTYNHCIRMIDPSGNISTVAGTRRAGYSGDGGPATAAWLSRPFGVCADPSGDILVADTYNHRIRRFTVGGDITTVAGTGRAGYSGDGGPAMSAQLYMPSDIYADASGTILVADTFNNRIRKFTPGGNITTVAGTGRAGSSGDDGSATAARMNKPYGVCADSSGSIFVADTNNHRIRKVYDPTAADPAPPACTPAVERALPVFKLWHSEDQILGEGDTVIGESLYLSSGSPLAFTELSQTLPKGGTGSLFVTVNIGPAVGGRTISISETGFDRMGFGYREKTAADPPAVKTGTSPLAAGGVQTFAKNMGNLVEMDGVQDYMDVSYSPDLNPSRFTVSVRASLSRQQDAEGNATLTRQSIVSSIDEDRFRGYEIFAAPRDETSDVYQIRFRIGTGSGWQVLEGPEIITHQFYDVTGTYNGAGMSLFVNGEPFEENVRTAFRANASKPLRIGIQPDGEGAFDGQISDMHVWNISRTTDDIKAGLTPTDEESGIVAHYRFMPWGTLVDTTGSDHDGTIFGDIEWASVLSGLWIGQIEITQVNEVGYGTADTDTPRDVANPFDMRILLHVNAGEKVSLLRNVSLMQTRYDAEKADGTTEEMVRRVLVTDDDQLYQYEGVVRRDGKMVGIRLGSIFFDFDPSLDALPVSGKVRDGSSLTGSPSLSADHPHNPFRHLYHPDHRSGREVARKFTMTVGTGADVDKPNAAVSELSGGYEEIIEGLHKEPIRLKGTFHLERISTIAVLNDE